jgi:hypothetical protein
MERIGEEQKMTVKEVAITLCKDESTIRKIGKELFPDTFKNGKKTLLTEVQVTKIKLNLGKNSELPKTQLEKQLIIQQAHELKKCIVPRDLTLKSKLGDVAKVESAVTETL